MPSFQHNSEQMEGEPVLKILLVDDDTDLLDLLKYNFQKAGFHVRAVSKASQAIAAAVKFRPDLIILDLSMPDGSGIALCREIRAIGDLRNAFIFILSARNLQACGNLPIDAGADDFIEKLHGLRALTNKVDAVLKKNFIIKKGIAALAVNELVVNKRLQTVYFRDRRIAVSDPEFEILFFMMQNPDRVISRKNLIEVIWGSDTFVRGPSVDNYVLSLQKKVGSKFIETVSTDRYRFVFKGNSSDFLPG